jgi:hypothetical protein
MGMACGAYGGGERGAQGVGRETGLWGDPDVDGRIILRWIFRKLGGGGVGGGGDWMGLAQDRDGWGTLVSTVKNLRFP